MMANTGGGSFIPKRSTGRVAPARVGKRIYIFSYIAYVLFFGTLLSVVGIFFLHNQAATQLQEYIDRVDQARQAFQEQTEIDEIRALETQLNTAEQILSWHAAPSVVFEVLEKVIVESIQLSSFTYSRETGGSAMMEFGGLSDSFDVLLFQREIMSESDLLASADIVEVSYGAGEGNKDVNTGTTNAPTPQSETRVTFSFQDIGSVSDGLGYTPRSFAPPVPQSTETPAADNTTPEVSDANGEPEGPADELTWDPASASGE